MQAAVSEKTLVIKRDEHIFEVIMMMAPSLK